MLYRFQVLERQPGFIEHAARHVGVDRVLLRQIEPLAFHGRHRRHIGCADQQVLLGFLRGTHQFIAPLQGRGSNLCRADEHVIARAAGGPHHIGQVFAGAELQGLACCLCQACFQRTADDGVGRLLGGGFHRHDGRQLGLGPGADEQTRQRDSGPLKVAGHGFSS